MSASVLTWKGSDCCRRSTWSIQRLSVCTASRKDLGGARSNAWLSTSCRLSTTGDNKMSFNTCRVNLDYSVTQASNQDNTRLHRLISTELTMEALRQTTHLWRIVSLIFFCLPIFLKVVVHLSLKSVSCVCTAWGCSTRPTSCSPISLHLVTWDSCACIAFSFTCCDEGDRGENAIKFGD